MPSLTLACHKCRHTWAYEPPLARKAECPGCGADAHVCHNCRYFDTGAHRQCREVQAEWVQDKERSNFCANFNPIADHGARSSPDLQKAKLEALFGGGAAKEAAGTPKASLAADLAAFMAGKKGL